MKVDLSYDELTLLIQLINQRLVETARRDPTATGAFESALMTKLYEAHIDEMDVIDPGRDHRRSGRKTPLEP
jgi:hypothetical protein